MDDEDEATTAALIEACAPTFHFHNGECDFPISVDRYLAHTVVIDRATRTVVEHLTPPTNAILDQLCGDEVYDLERLAYLHTSAQALPPTLIHVVRGDNSTLYLQYILFYANNGPSWVPLLSAWIGTHQADVEHVTVEVVDGRPVAYHFSRHSDSDEVRVPVEELEPGPTPLSYHVYVARGGHSHYEHAGTHSRLCGITADVCDEEGVSFRPTQFMRLYAPDTPGYDPTTMGFLRLRNGRLGGGLSAVGTWTDRLGIVGRVINLSARRWWTHGISRAYPPQPWCGWTRHD